MYDVAIVGAGPAGATLARLIGGKFKVLLLDRRSCVAPEPKAFHKAKCCGGLLAPDAQKMIAILGLGLPKEIIVGPQLFTVRTIDLHHQLEKYYQRFYINIDRRKFDSWLLSLVPDRVDLRLGCSFKSFVQSDGQLQLHFLQDGQSRVEQARFLIGADGAFSTVRRAAFPAWPEPIKYTAVQEWLRTDQTQPYFTTIFDPAITDFYAWTIPKEEMLLLGAAIPYRHDVNGRFNLLKNKLEAYGVKLGAAVKREGTLLLRPMAANQICTGAKGVALIGEAAGWISPSSAEGLSYAFKSALLCARSLSRETPDFARSYRRQATAMFTNIGFKNLKSTFMYQPGLRKIIMLSGLLTMDVRQDPF
ncbi:MAG: FAD-binding protein [Firmicutes bacterium]|nr:FAD-binding protein [Bacillota bacterium]